MKENLWEKYDYSISLSDLASLPFCRKGYCELEDKTTVKMLLHLLGMDVNKPFERVELIDDITATDPITGEEFVVEANVPQTFRSYITGATQTGGYIYQGYKRKDYKMYNVELAERLLTTDEGIKELVKLMKKETKKKLKRKEKVDVV